MASPFRGCKSSEVAIEILNIRRDRSGVHVPILPPPFAHHEFHVTRMHVTVPDNLRCSALYPFGEAILEVGVFFASVDSSISPQPVY